MAGGMHSKRGAGAPLWARTRSAGRSEEEPAPCWVELDPVVPGSVLAWRRDEELGWQALVAVWLPAGKLRRRDSEGAAGG